MNQDTQYLERCESALLALELMAREGRGPVFSQCHVATSHGVMTTGRDFDSFMAGIVALEKTTRTK